MKFKIQIYNSERTIQNLKKWIIQNSKFKIWKQKN